MMHAARALRWLLPLPLLLGCWVEPMQPPPKPPLDGGGERAPVVSPDAEPVSGDCPIVWEAGPWGACSAGCGVPGTRTRLVRCVRCDGVVMVDGACSGARPTDETTCLGTADCTYSYGPWSDWSACAWQQQTRTRSCLRSDGAEASCEQCGGECSELRSC